MTPETSKSIPSTPVLPYAHTNESTPRTFGHFPVGQGLPQPVAGHHQKTRNSFVLIGRRRQSRLDLPKGVVLDLSFAYQVRVSICERESTPRYHKGKECESTTHKLASTLRKEAHQTVTAMSFYLNIHTRACHRDLGLSGEVGQVTAESRSGKFHFLQIAATGLWIGFQRELGSCNVQRRSDPQKVSMEGTMGAGVRVKVVMGEWSARIQIAEAARNAEAARHPQRSGSGTVATDRTLVARPSNHLLVRKCARVCICFMMHCMHTHLSMCVRVNFTVYALLPVQHETFWVCMYMPMHQCVYAYVYVSMRVCIWHPNALRTDRQCLRCISRCVVSAQRSILHVRNHVTTYKGLCLR